MRPKVTLSEPDQAYLQRCIEQDTPLSESFLKETRAQRMGCSVRDLDCMLNYELNRHLADEAVIMSLDTWATEPCAYIDWETINARAVIRSQELADDFAAFRQARRDAAIQKVLSKRGK